MSHTRTDANPYLDEAIENMNFGNYDMIWLGGDLALQTSEDEATIQHVDSILDLKNPNTLWAVGNHDNADIELVNATTKRNNFYVII